MPDILRLTVIKSWASSATRRLFESGESKFRGLDADLALNRLAALHASSRLEQISPLRSVGLHPLKGSRKGQWAMSVNGPWRLCFRYHNGDAYDVEIVDYH
jgi:toxin HigB-1